MSHEFLFGVLIGVALDIIVAPRVRFFKAREPWTHIEGSLGYDFSLKMWVSDSYVSIGIWKFRIFLGK